MSKEQCPSVHLWSQQRCIREAGHEGKCWGRAQAGGGRITRALWQSENGAFVSHYTYDTHYPSNARRQKENPHAPDPE